MSYESLYKLKYSQPRQYESIYQNRFQDADTIHLDFNIHGNPAFICPTLEIMQLIVKIHKTDKEVRALRNALPGVAIQQFTNRCLVDEIVLTNDIEGVNSTRHEIREVFEKLESKKSDKRFYGLVMKYAMLSKRESIKLDTCEDVRSIYNDLVLREVVEENPNDMPDGKLFRKESVAVTNAAQKEIHHGIVPESAIYDAVEKVLAFLKDESVDLLIRIAGAHYLIGYIHPFYNGNGRLSRFISSFLLAQELDPLVGYRLSYTIKENLKQYGDSFKLCNDPRNLADVTPFVLWFLEIILEAINKLRQALAQRADDLRVYGQRVDKDRVLNTKKNKDLAFYLVQASLFSEPGIAKKELVEIAGVSNSTLSARLHELEENGYLIIQRIGKEKYYKLNLERLK